MVAGNQVGGTLLTDIALTVFVAVVAANLIGLLVDLVIRNHLGVDHTITRIARQNTGLALILISWQALGVLALAYHLWGAGK